MAFLAHVLLFISKTKKKWENRRVHSMYYFFEAVLKIKKFWPKNQFQLMKNDETRKTCKTIRLPLRAVRKKQINVIFYGLRVAAAVQLCTFFGFRRFSSTKIRFSAKNLCFSEPPQKSSTQNVPLDFPIFCQFSRKTAKQELKMTFQCFLRTARSGSRIALHVFRFSSFFVN